LYLNGVSENIQLLSMRSDVLFTDESEYKENYIAVADQRDPFEKANYPNGVWIVRLETDRAPATIATVNGKTIKRTPRWNMGRFRSKESARKFIRSRVEPEEVDPRTYPQICNCLSWQYPFEYRKCGAIIFERCSKCLMPTKHIFRTPLNAEVLKDFDLDEFLGFGK
jgi:hypothetical protein